MGTQRERKRKQGRERRGGLEGGRERERGRNKEKERARQRTHLTTQSPTSPQTNKQTKRPKTNNKTIANKQTKNTQKTKTRVSMPAHLIRWCHPNFPHTSTAPNQEDNGYAADPRCATDEPDQTERRALICRSSGVRSDASARLDDSVSPTAAFNDPPPETATLNVLIPREGVEV